MTAPQFVWEDVQYLRAITSQEHQKGKGWQKDIPTKKVTQRHFSGQVRTFSKGYQAQTDATEECWTKQGKMQNSECLLYLFGNRTPIFQQSLRWTQLKQPISNTGQYKTFQSKTKQLFCVVHQVGQTFSYQHSALQCNLTKYKHKLQSFPFLWKTSITFSFSENANRLDLLQSQPTFKTTAFVQMIQTDLFWFIIICRWRLLARAVFSL